MAGIYVNFEITGEEPSSSYQERRPFEFTLREPLPRGADPRIYLADRVMAELHRLIPEAFLDRVTATEVRRHIRPLENTLLGREPIR